MPHSLEPFANVHYTCWAGVLPDAMSCVCLGVQLPQSAPDMASQLNTAACYLHLPQVYTAIRICFSPITLRQTRLEIACKLDPVVPHLVTQTTAPPKSIVLA